MIQFQHAIALTVPTWAVLAGDDGQPIFQPVVALGVFNDEANGSRLPSMLVATDHVFSADFLQNFVAYTHSPADPDGAWAEKCRLRRESIEKAKASPIVMPEKKVLFPS